MTKSNVYTILDNFEFLNNIKSKLEIDHKVNYLLQYKI